jgi:hypothetical protein
VISRVNFGLGFRLLAVIWCATSKPLLFRKIIIDNMYLLIFVEVTTQGDCHVIIFVY